MTPARSEHTNREAPRAAYARYACPACLVDVDGLLHFLAHLRNHRYREKEVWSIVSNYGRLA